MIIFINGASSSGKSTIAKSLQHLSPKPLLMMGIDAFLNMMPSKYTGTREKANEGFQFVMDRDEEGPITRVIEGPYGAQICKLAPKIIDIMAIDGHDIIVDEVLFEDEKLCDYVKAVNKHKVYFIGIHCSLAVLSEREVLRGNRALGMGREQIHRVHGPTRFYDLELDTTKKSAFDCAKEILHFIDETPNPEGFKKLYKTFYD